MEFQYIGFRSIDRPLTDKELEYAESQSSRAKITRWSFDNVYHYGDFGGNSDEMLRRGYDIFLHYANFGIRELKLRLPDGLPFPKTIWGYYIDGERIQWKKDKKGKGGILTISPYIEPGYLDDLWELSDYIDSIAGIRNELLKGDLRILYTLWLCASIDDNFDPADLLEPPIPAGLANSNLAVESLLEFYARDPLMLTAANELAPSLQAQNEISHPIENWICNQPVQFVQSALLRFLTEDTTAVKSELLRSFREQYNLPSWPTQVGTRTMKELLQRTEVLRNEAILLEVNQKAANEKKEAAKREKERQARMKQMTKSPTTWLNKASKLVKLRGRANYNAAANILYDLREAIGGNRGAKLANNHAAKLRKENPTLSLLISILRKKGLLP